MKQLLSFVVVAVLALTFSSCAGQYDVKTMAVAEETQAVSASREMPEYIDFTIREIVLFDFDSFELDTEAKLILQKVAIQMAENPDILLILKGHTDKYGSDEYNQMLSEDRADAVENYLAEEGVTVDRIMSVEGFGKSQLLPNMTNRENRRVIIMSVNSK